MSRLHELANDARMAIETIECCAGRPLAACHAASAAEWLEQIARQLREEIKAEKTEVPA